MTAPHPLLKPVLTIAGLSYLIAVVLGDMQFDLLGNSAMGRSYYCSLQDAAFRNPLRLLPLGFVIVLTAVTLFLEAKAAVGTELFIFELSMVSAILLVEIPLFTKCLQLQLAGCASVGTEVDPWYVHRNLLMSHMCLLLILVGSVVGRTALLFYRTPSTLPRISSKVSETSSSRKVRRRKQQDLCVTYPIYHR